MHRLANWKIVALFSALLVGTLFASPDDGFDDMDGPNVRMIRHADGTRDRFTKTPDGRTIIKKRFSPNGVLIMVAIYRLDLHGNPIGCKIYDGDKHELFKVSYGYRKSDGQLVEERMFDARVKRIDPKTGEEMPVQRVCYVYDADGNRSAPIVFNLLPGKSYQQLFGEKSTLYKKNPFNGKAPGTANPNAHPVGDQ